MSSKGSVQALDTTQSIWVIRFVIIVIQRLVDVTCCQSVIQYEDSSNTVIPGT